MNRVKMKYNIKINNEILEIDPIKCYDMFNKGKVAEWTSVSVDIDDLKKFKEYFNAWRELQNPEGYWTFTSGSLNQKYKVVIRFSDPDTALLFKLTNSYKGN